jgi:hypothetical protein
MDRQPEAIAESWGAVNGNLNNVPLETRAATQANVKKNLSIFLGKHNTLTVPYDDMFSKTVEQLNLIKGFLPIPFDVDKALPAIDKNLYVDRGSGGFVKEVYSPEKTAKIEALNKEIDSLQISREFMLKPMDERLAKLRKKLFEVTAQPVITIGEGI